MIEVPSAAVMADAFAEAADFFSIGTNDLVQYTLAADRTNPELADLASALQPAVLRLIDGVVRAARIARPTRRRLRRGGGDPSVVPFLVGLGVEELSVTPAAIASVRSTLAGLDPIGLRAPRQASPAAPARSRRCALLLDRAPNARLRRRVAVDRGSWRGRRGRRPKESSVRAMPIGRR